VIVRAQYGTTLSKLRRLDLHKEASSTSAR